MKRNTVLGIIGPTGSGKTTLTQLIPRFYDVNAGSVAFDDVDVRSWKLDPLRSQISQVPHTAVLFTGTIRENLQWGKEDATDEECWEALRIAQAEDFVRQLPKGLETKVMENGKNFSGGQKQRVAIARALAMNPRVLAYDEPTSALDPELRQQVENLIVSLKAEGVTQIIVTHDLVFAENVGDQLVKVIPNK